MWLFNGTRSFQLPHDFTRIVTARAESDLSGMRNKHERRRALKLCAGLALVSFALLGAAARDSRARSVAHVLQSYRQSVAACLAGCL